MPPLGVVQLRMLQWPQYTLASTLIKLSNVTSCDALKINI